MGEAIQVTRQAVESTPADHPDRVRRLNLGTKLGSCTSVLLAKSHDTAEITVQTIKRRREAAAELDTYIRRIRGIPDHRRFLLGQIVAELQECAGEGSIAVVNITESRSLAMRLIQ
ncbi:hypothetical protein V8E54_013548 [Elaphomyces granulatus]